jgi:nickel-dependent lactate racemase
MKSAGRSNAPRLPEVRPGFLPSLSHADIEAAWTASRRGLDSLLGDAPVTVVVNDVTRPPVAGALLEPIAGLLEGRCRVLVATGTHRAVTEAEKDGLLAGLLRGSPWRCTEAADGWRAGTTSFGTEVILDPWVSPGSRILLVGSVEPHYFAGYTGGRKSILPGCAAESTIVQNHYLACLPGSAPTVLEGNPVSEDMAEAAEFVCSSSTVLCAGCAVQAGRIVQFSVGEMGRTFLESVRASEAGCCVFLDSARTSVVLRPGVPLDANLYQAMKAVYNCEGAVSDGGTLLLDCHCGEGLGASHMRSSLEAALDPCWNTPSKRDYSLGDHSTARLVRIRSRIRLALHSLLEEGLVASLGFEPVDDVAEWVSRRGSDAVCIPDAGAVVASVRGRRAG